MLPELDVLFLVLSAPFLVREEGGDEGAEWSGAVGERGREFGLEHLRC